jgi:rubrerythrin
MKREIKGSNEHKNEETSPSIVCINSIQEKDAYYNNFTYSENLVEDNNSLLKIGDSEFIGFSPFHEDDEIDENLLYLIKDEKNHLFKVSKKQRGRKKKEITLNKKRIEKVHNKYGKDNMIRKCQVSYFNFIIDFINLFIRLFNSKMRLNPKKEFFPIDYDIKKIVNRSQKIMMRTNSIEDMMKKNISKKHSRSRLSSNKDLCEEIKQYGIPEIEKIFKKNFISFFDIYHKSVRKFNLKQLDESFANLTIEIPETIELYKDMLNKNRKDIKFEEYKELMENYIKNYFVCSNLFSIKV